MSDITMNESSESRNVEEKEPVFSQSAQESLSESLKETQGVEPMRDAVQDTDSNAPSTQTTQVELTASEESQSTAESHEDSPAHSASTPENSAPSEQNKQSDLHETQLDETHSNEATPQLSNEQSAQDSEKTSDNSDKDNAAHTPSPQNFAKRTNNSTVASLSLYTASDVEEAESFGRADDNGTVYVKEGDGEREVGQFPDATAQEALTFYARRYLDLKARLDLCEKRFHHPNIRPREIDQSLKTLRKEVEKPDVVGDLKALKNSFEKLSANGEEKKHEISETRKKLAQEAVVERTAIVEKAEKITASLSNNTNWKAAGEEFKNLFAQWQEHQKSAARIDRNTADELWSRFSAARTAFNQARRKWITDRENTRNSARATKEAIIKEAESLKDSTDWAATSRKYTDLMERWRKVDHINRKEDEQLWTQFRAAADAFFAARQADRDKTSADETKNLQDKEALIVKAQALLPVATVQEAKRARKQLAAIQEEWDTIGFVPRADRHRLESQLDTVEREIKQVEDSAWKQADPEADARKNSFAGQLTAQLEELDKRIAQCTDEAQKSKLLAEKATKEQWLNAIK